jgi:hypothetical protein
MMSSVGVKVVKVTVAAGEDEPATSINLSALQWSADRLSLLGRSFKQPSTSK